MHLPEARARHAEVVADLAALHVLLHGRAGVGAPVHASAAQVVRRTVDQDQRARRRWPARSPRRGRRRSRAAEQVERRDGLVARAASTRAGARRASGGRACPRGPSASATRSMRVRQPRPPHSSSPGAACTGTSRSSFARRRSCSASTAAFQARCAGSATCASSPPPTPPGPAAGHADSTRSGRRLEDLDGVGAPELRVVAGVGQPGADALARQRVPDEDRRGRRAGRRSGRRGRPGRSRARRARRAVVCRVSSHADRYPGRVLETRLALGGGELPGHGGHHDAGREEQAALESQGALVVQQLLPPVPDHVLGDVDDDQVPRALPADRAHVGQHRARDLAERRVEHAQRHGDVERVPLLAQRGDVLGVDTDGDGLEHAAAATPARRPARASSAGAGARPARSRAPGWAARAPTRRPRRGRAPRGPGA